MFNGAPLRAEAGAFLRGVLEVLNAGNRSLKDAWMEVAQKGFSGGILKQIAVVTMLIDHITCCFMERVYVEGVPLFQTAKSWYYLDMAGRAIGRTAFPIFCFLITEGYLHTSNKFKYLGRLLLFGLISHYPFNWIFFPGSAHRHTGTMFTLALGFLSIWVIDAALTHFPADRDFAHRGTGSRWLNLLIALIISLPAVGAFCWISEYIGSDYGYGGVMTIVILFLLRRSRDLQAILSWAWLAFYNSYELFAIPGFFLIRCYNGSKGKQSKYFFYIFYPAHLLVLFLIRKKLFGY